MVSEKIKHKADLEYEWTLELAKFVDRMLNDEMVYDRTIVIHFLEKMEDPILYGPLYIPDSDLLAACKVYYEEKV